MGNQQSSTAAASSLWRPPTPGNPSRPPTPQVWRGQSRTPTWVKKKDIRRVEFRLERSDPLFTETVAETRGSSEHVERAPAPAPAPAQFNKGNLPLIEVGGAVQPPTKRGLLKRSAEKIQAGFKAGLRSLKKNHHQRLADEPATTQDMSDRGRSLEIEELHQAFEGVATIDWAMQASRDSGKGKEVLRNPDRGRSRVGEDSTDDGSQSNRAQNGSDTASQSSELPLLTRSGVGDNQEVVPKPIRYSYKWPYELKRPDAPDDENTFELPLESHRQAKEAAQRKLRGDAPKLPELPKDSEWKFDFDFAEAAFAANQEEAGDEEAGQQEAGQQEADQSESGQSGSNKKVSDKKEIDQKETGSELAKVTTINVDELVPEHALKPAKPLPTSAPKNPVSI